MDLQIYPTEPTTGVTVKDSRYGVWYTGRKVAFVTII